MKELFDPLRKEWVAATPEEIVRQTWIQRMMGELKYPKELLAVEKELSSLPHLRGDKVPARRIDLLCFLKNEETVVPLLLIECKEGLLSEEALHQVISYNFYVKAPYVALVNQSQVRFRYQQVELARLPPYAELMEKLYG